MSSLFKAILFTVFSLHLLIYTFPLVINKYKFKRNSLSTKLSFLDSLLAGSLAGAIGFGAAYPFDSIKTKSQTLAASLLQSNISKLNTFKSNKYFLSI